MTKQNTITESEIPARLKGVYQVMDTEARAALVKAITAPDQPQTTLQSELDAFEASALAMSAHDGTEPVYSKLADCNVAAFDRVLAAPVNSPKEAALKLGWLVSQGFDLHSGDVFQTLIGIVHALAVMPTGQGDETICDLYSQLVAGMIDCETVHRDLPDDEFNALTRTLTDIKDQIIATPARTLDGLAIKAGLSVDELVVVDGPEDILEEAAVALIADLEGLTNIEPMPKVYQRIISMKRSAA